MQVERVSALERFDALRSEYEAVYVADPHASVFLSWDWLRGWFTFAPYPWMVLAAKTDDGAPPSAFLPLILRGPQWLRLRPIRQLLMGGRPLAWYTGFVCCPSDEAHALAAFAHYVDRCLEWDQFALEYVVDPRLKTFLDRFDRTRFAIASHESWPSLGIPLPSTWEGYLAECMGPKSRETLRHDTRHIEQHSGLRCMQAQPDTLDRALDALLELWQWRWGPKRHASWERRILRHCFENDRLWLSVLWDGALPVAAVAAIIDRTKQTCHSYMTGYDSRYAALSPGTVVFGYQIRQAIEQGFRTYDFLLGADPYKLALGAKQRSSRSAVITRRNRRSTVASAVAMLGAGIDAALVMLLGPIKRTRIVKRIWFAVGRWLGSMRPRTTC
jgi:CelD/BcsL family acetyltransferase involved in cellulose biosynthesis